MNLPFAMRRSTGKPNLDPANWSQTGSHWTISGNVATRGGATASTDRLFGPILPSVDCSWLLDLLHGVSQGAEIVLGVARSDLMPVDYNAAGYSGWNFGAQLIRDGVIVGSATGFLNAGIYRMAVRASNSTLYMRNITTGETATIELPAGYSASLLRPIMLPVGSTRASAILYAPTAGSGGLY